MTSSTASNIAANSSEQAPPPADRTIDTHGRRIRQQLLFTTAALVGVGLVATYSATAVLASQQHGSALHFLTKQGGIALFGALLIGLIQGLPRPSLRHLPLPLLGISTALLVIIHIPGLGITLNGATRWMRGFGFSFQPGELAKVALVFFLARNLTRPSALRNGLGREMLPNLAITGAIVGLIMTQPDFGTAVLIAGVAFALLFAEGLSYRIVAGIFGCGIILGLLAIFAAPYRMQRILSFLDPWGTAQGGGLQIIQSYLGFHNGGLFGVGLGESRQKLFLPAAHADFILPVIGEELGILAVLGVIGGFAVLVRLGFAIAQRAQSRFESLLATGLASLIGGQAVLNVGVNIGLFPTTGIPLPLVSSGASSLLVFLLVIAILARLADQTEPSNGRRLAPRSVAS